MKPAPFRYHAPTSLDEAVGLLTDLQHEEARVLAGGQSIVPMLALRLAHTDHVVDINRVPELAQLGASNGHLVIGACVRQRTAERSPEVAQGCPLLAEALPLVGHAEIRNRGTVGGSLAHADPAAEAPAVALALDATMVVRGPSGEREIPARDFFLGYLETALQPGELLVEVRFPRPGPGTGSAIAEVSRRHGDYALVGAAAVLTLGGDGAIRDARLSYLGVGATPVRATAAEESLRGAQPTPEAFREAAERARGELDPGGDLQASAAYRRHVAGVLTEQVLATAADRARSAA